MKNAWNIKGIPRPLRDKLDEARAKYAQERGERITIGAAVCQAINMWIEWVMGGCE